jgi:SAM-dependent methyltransferase
MTGTTTNPVSVRLNIGCGPVKMPGYINCDHQECWKPDILMDAVKSWPFDDHVADRVVMHHVIEHLPDSMFPIREAYRVLKVGGTLSIRVPHAHGIYACVNGHRHFFTTTTVRQIGDDTDPRASLIGVRFRETAFRLRIWMFHRTPFDGLASRHPFLWEKLGILPPDEIEWEGVKT